MVFKKIIDLFKSKPRETEITAKAPVRKIEFAKQPSLSPVLVEILHKNNVYTTDDILKYDMDRIMSFSGMEIELLKRLVDFLKQQGISGAFKKEDVQPSCNFRQIPGNVANIRFDECRELPARLINALTRENIYTIQDILKYNLRQIALLPNIGENTLKQLKDFLKGYDIVLGESYEIVDVIEPTEPEEFVDMSARDYIHQNFDQRISAIIISHYEGETLEELGKRNNITKERVRQICNKIDWNKVKVFFKEDSYREVFQKYDWDKDTFCNITQEEVFTYRYLAARYKKGDIPVTEYLKETQPMVQEEQKQETKNLSHELPNDSVPEKEVKSSYYSPGLHTEYVWKNGETYIRITRCKRGYRPRRWRKYKK